VPALRPENLLPLFLPLVFATALVLLASPSLARDNFLILLLDDVGVDPPYDSHEKAIRGEAFKLIERDGVYEEFFNLDNDRWEETNLLPVANFSSEELAAYDSLVEAMEGVDTWRRPSVAAVVPTLAWETFTLLCLGVWLTAVVIQKRRSSNRRAFRPGELIVISKSKKPLRADANTPK